MKALRRLWPLLILMSLMGCKVDLYSGLSEDEANQMLALLMLRNVDAEKKIIKEGNVTVRVEKSSSPMRWKCCASMVCPASAPKPWRICFPPANWSLRPHKNKPRSAI